MTPHDPYQGVGGAYVIDPATGLRVPEAEWYAREAAQAAAVVPSLAPPQPSDEAPAPPSVAGRSPDRMSTGHPVDPTHPKRRRRAATLE